MIHSKLVFNSSIDPNVLKIFLLSLGKNSLKNFNPFGEITEKNIDQIVTNELKRSDKIRYFIFSEKKLIGYSFLTLFEKSSKKHNCTLGIVIGDNFQNLGYGKIICNHMISDAWNRGLEKIWLTVFLDNFSALKFYTHLGFNIEGIFLHDEKLDHNDRHVVSMAILKNNLLNNEYRKSVWKELEKRLLDE
jgi:RimJ/RimL family protein N-acetyltransferase